MKQILILFIPLLVGLGIYKAYQYFFPSDEIRIVSQLKVLVDTIEIKPEENPLQTAARLKKIREILAPEARFIFQANQEEFRFISSDEFINRLLQAKAYFHSLSIRWEDLSFPQRPYEGKAESLLTMIVEAELKNTNEKILEASPFRIDWSQDPKSGNWLIFEIKNEKVMEFR